MPSVLSLRAEWVRHHHLVGAILTAAFLAAMILGIALAPAIVQAENGSRGIDAAELAVAIEAARPGDTITVTGGVFQGSLVIDKPLTLIGIDWPTIDGQNSGSVVKVTAPESVVRGFRIINSGDSLEQENTGLAVEGADHVIVEGNRFEETLFGVYFSEAHNGILRNNVIHSKDLDLARRGDPIRVWSSNDVLVENNQVLSGRDVVLWYSERLTVRGNIIDGGRYGLHFMYCDDALIEDNTLTSNSVGVFLMYSRRLNLIHNTVAFNRGPSGFGIGLKDMDDAIITENLILDNRVGAHLDLSPREVDSIGRFEGNVFGYNDIGVELLPSVRRNEFFDNSFIENQEQVAIGSGAQPGQNAWTVAGKGNYWSDYAGYDADGDGQGDIAYRSERLFELLMQEAPELRLFLYSPASNAVDFAAKAFPFVRPQPKLVDEQPYTTPLISTAAPALPAGGYQMWLLLAIILVGLSLGLLSLSRLQSRRYHFPVLDSKTALRENS
jgi:nitrous oxidase accessory protein